MVIYYFQIHNFSEASWPHDGSVSGEIFGKLGRDLSVFSSPTGYMLISFSFPYIKQRCNL